MPKGTKVATLPSARDKLIDDFRAVVADAEELLKLTAGQAGDRVNVVRGKVEQSLQTAKAQLGEVEEMMLARGREAVDATDDYVRANPWRAIGIAAGVGMIFGMLMARR